ncbi:MAG TPA: low affinity iron permease family protein [Tepidisphaeraceae bacterium]|jgi:low affinity Fe/Cu permease
MSRALLTRVAERVRRRKRFSAVNDAFRRFATGSARGFGSAWMFIAAALICAGWLISGPIFHYSETWQFFINDLTNVATFLAVFLIQNTQNRDAKAIHLKLDELLRAIDGARTHLIDLEDFSDEELDHLQREFERIRNREARRTEASDANGKGRHAMTP